MHEDFILRKRSKNDKLRTTKPEWNPNMHEECMQSKQPKNDKLRDNKKVPTRG